MPARPATTATRSDCDACPSTCQTAPADCAATGTLDRVFRLQPPPDVELSGAIICVRYPAASVRFAGTGTVSGRVIGFDGIALQQDYGTSTRVSLLKNPPAVSPLDFTLRFDRCTGAAIPPTTSFSCVTESASDENSNGVQPPTLVVCTPQ